MGEDLYKLKMIKNKTELMCVHCNKSIEKVTLNGLSIMCPHCGKPNESKLNMNTSIFKSGIMMFEQRL